MIASTRPNAIRFPRRSRETLARHRAYPQSDATGEDIESPTRPLRLGPWLARRRVFPRLKPKRKLRPPAKRKKLVKVRGAARDIFNPAGRDPEWASSLRGFFLRGMVFRRNTALPIETGLKAQ